MEFEPDEATYLWVAETVLRRHRRPLRANELVSYGEIDGLFSDRALSKTPQKSMQARISIEIISNGADSKFVRTSKGKFYLRELLEVEANEGDTGLFGASLEEYTAHRRLVPPPSETVLAIPESKYKSLLNFQGFKAFSDVELRELLKSENCIYLPRTVAETRNDAKQVITYTIIQYKSKILAFKRGQYNRAPSFLRGARCIGFGGHVTDEDLSLFSFSDAGLRENAAREIREEISFLSGRPNIDLRDLELLGVINDNSSDVGIRHVAIVLRYWVEDWDLWKTLRRGEASINQIRWIETSKDSIDLSEFEYWSQICISSQYLDSVIRQPNYKLLRRAAFQSPKIVCVIGAIGSGKSATTRYLVQHANFTEINSGQVMAKLLKIPPVPKTPRPEFQEAAQAFIDKRGGFKRLAQAIYDEAINEGRGRVVIDGIRNPETLAHLKDLAKDSIAIIYVYTPPNVAFEMYTKRESYNENNLSFEGFLQRYNAPVESKVKYMINDADLITYNWLGYEKYEKVLEHILIELGL